MFTWSFAFHVLGVIFWVAALLLAGKVLGMNSQAKNTDTREALGRLQRTPLVGWGLPGIVVTGVSGALLLINNPAYYMRGRGVAAGRSKVTRGQSAALHGDVALVVFVILVLVFNKP